MLKEGSEQGQTECAIGSICTGLLLYTTRFDSLIDVLPVSLDINMRVDTCEYCE